MRELKHCDTSIVYWCSNKNGIFIWYNNCCSVWHKVPNATNPPTREKIIEFTDGLKRLLAPSGIKYPILTYNWDLIYTPPFDSPFRLNK